MRKITPFRAGLLLSSFFITFFLLCAIGALLAVPTLDDILTNIWSEEMQLSLRLSLVTGLISTILVMLFALPIGYTLSRLDFWGKGVVKTIIDLPVAFPELVLGLCLLLLFGKTPIGTALNALGLDFVFTKKGVVAAQFFTALPYSVRIMKSTFDYINPRMEFVSRSLGYSQFETFLRVTIPLAGSGILASTVIAFARCIGTFGTVLILAGGSYMRTETLPITLYLNISYGNMGMALTSGIMLIGVSFIAIFIFEKTEAKL
ncbi:ABC transporter permease subunit [Pseudodesulfovibrio sp. JC047]|uniref:ABC transporter permease n=1 Tax=Pseudodesulfovibrio sp. JC047 TaxID=2683199 RepID=UPI0013D543C5|nr:ABC transporter permease [Pseudodesulfovibrio sp. JC047]NDV18623.1 ABC transporter permease subunit [Pseudodesulfovibrio sp. JC047]